MGGKSNPSGGKVNGNLGKDDSQTSVGGNSVHPGISSNKHTVSLPPKKRPINYIPTELLHQGHDKIASGFDKPLGCKAKQKRVKRKKRHSKTLTTTKKHKGPVKLDLKKNVEYNFNVERDYL